MAEAIGDIKTLNEVFLTAVDRGLEQLAGERDASGSWSYFSSRDLYLRVRNFAHAVSRLGIRKGDRVALLSENRFEWAITDFACLALGVVDVPIYPTLTGDEAAYILKDSQSRVLVLSTAQHLQKILAIRKQTDLEAIIVMDDVPGIASAFGPLTKDGGDCKVLTMSPLLDGNLPGRDAEFDAQAKSAKPEDLATIIYTSGTTGFPKGVMLTHGNLASNMNCSLAKSLDWSPGMRVISFLPLSHVTARHLDYLLFLHGVTVAYCRDLSLLPKMMKEVHPTAFVGVPRVYEKFLQQALHQAGMGFKRKIFDWAMRVGAAHRDEVCAGKTPTSLRWKIANALVFSKIRDGFGGRVRELVSGGAPLGIDTARWFADAGMRIYEGYGLTETSPVIALNTPQAFRIGTVGKPLANVECKIAGDGELLVRAPSVFHGYWNLPQETAAAFEPGGWFHTGDIAALDEDGFLRIVDRKKELLKTSGGKFIAPQPLENKLKANPLIAHPVLVGDRKKFASVILSPNFLLLESWAHKEGIVFKSRAELVSHPAVQALYEGIVAEVNSGLARYETMKKVLIVPDEFTIESGELTPSMKLKRRVVEQRYKNKIEALYDGAQAPETTTA